MQVENNKRTSSNGPTREKITSRKFYYMETFLTKKPIISFPLNMFLLKIELCYWTLQPLFKAKGKKKCLNVPFSKPLRSCQNKEAEIKKKMCKKLSKWKIKTAQLALHILALSAKFFNFFPPIYTLGKLQNLIASHYSLRLSPMPNLRITVATPTNYFPLLTSVVYVM